MTYLHSVHVCNEHAAGRNFFCMYTTDLHLSHTCQSLNQTEGADCGDKIMPRTLVLHFQYVAHCTCTCTEITWNHDTACASVFHYMCMRAQLEIMARIRMLLSPGLVRLGKAALVSPHFETFVVIINMTPSQWSRITVETKHQMGKLVGGSWVGKKNKKLNLCLCGIQSN